ISKVARHLDLKYGKISEAYFWFASIHFCIKIRLCGKICSPSTSIKDNSFMKRIPPNEGFYEIGLERNGVGHHSLVEKNCDKLFQYWDLFSVSANDNRTVIELPKWIKL
ncbi:8753_t:CDS:2, partial [Funneliformis caledonium]